MGCLPVTPPFWQHPVPHKETASHPGPGVFHRRREQPRDGDQRINRYGGPDEPEPAQEPPPTPQNLAATVNDDGSISLTWDAPDDDGITGYQILRRRASEGEDELLVYVEDTGSTATIFTDRDVTSGVRHVYRVKAINEASLSGRSNFAQATP